METSEGGSEDVKQRTKSSPGGRLVAPQATAAQGQGSASLAQTSWADEVTRVGSTTVGAVAFVASGDELAVPARLTASSAQGRWQTQLVIEYGQP